MRDLAKTLKNIEIFGYDEDYIIACDGRNGVLYLPLALVYEALERAIKAEAEVEVLQIVTKENYRMYENTLVEVEQLKHELKKCRDEYKAFREALAELDEEDE